MRTLLALLISIVSAAAVELSWDAVDHPEVYGYLLHYGPDPAAPSQHVAVGKVTSSQVEGLPIGSTIYFTCTAHNAAGAESRPSNQVSYTVPMPTPTVAPTPAPTLAPDRQLTVRSIRLLPEGTSVPISAPAAPAGYVFDRWNGPVANPTSASTTVTLGSSNTTVTAVYKRP